MQTDDSNIIEVKRWKEVGSAVLGSMRSSTAPLSSKCTNSLIEELKPDIDIYLELDMRGRQGRAYVVDACTIIAAPLTITKFYAQNEIMWECGVFDMLAADTTGALCVLFHFKQCIHEYVILGPQSLNDEHLPANINVKHETCQGNDVCECFMYNAHSSTSTENKMTMIFMDVGSGGLSSLMFALTRLAVDGSILMSLKSLREPESGAIVGVMQKYFKKVQIIHPKSNGTATEMVYLCAFNIKSVEKCIQFVTNIHTGYFASINPAKALPFPDEFMYAVMYWSTLIQSRVHAKSTRILSLCSKIIIHSPLVRKDRLNALVVACIESAVRKGIYSKYAETYTFGCKTAVALQMLINLMDTGMECESMD